MKKELPALILFCCLAWTFRLGAQEITISGTLTEEETGETLIGATVNVPELSVGATTNAYGFYSLNLEEGDSVEVVFSYVGYQPQILRLARNQDQVINLELSSGVELEEVTVTAGGIRDRLRDAEMSFETITTREARLVPVLLGESDILKAVQLKPGIPSGSEGTTGIFVRGGGNDQNLIVLDEATVYNASHLFGFFSTFNTDAVKDLKIYKGGFPAEYGGRLSSVIDVKLNDGNVKEFAGSGGIGLIASRLTLEGPIIKDKSSFIVSGRRTYVDIFTRIINEANENNEDFEPIPDYFFYDLNTKINYKLGENDRLFLSGYFGRDVFGFDGDFFEFDFDWGNATGTARWNHIFSPRLFANTTLTYSNYQYNINNEVTGFSFNLSSNIEDFSLKSDYYYSLNNQHDIRFGGQGIYHQFTVGRLRADSEDGVVSFRAGQNFSGWEYGFYVSDEYSPIDRLTMNIGLRLSGFNGEGGNYVNLEPRFAVNYELTPRLSAKASYARMNQYLHLIASAGATLPTDVWYPSTDRVKPQVSDQVATGLSYLLGEGLLLNWEVYYKRLDNQLEFVDGAELFGNDELENEFAIGEGEAYGMEIGIEKQTGRLTGWIGYTLARVVRRDFAPLDPSASFAQTGQFSPIYDRRHDLSIVAFYELSDRLTASATFVYGSGDLRWLPTGRFAFQDTPGTESESVTPIYGDRNNFRLPDFHRLDLGLIWELKAKKLKESNLTINIVNAYDRRNAFFIYLEPTFREVMDEDGATFEIPESIDARQVSLFPILPSVTWNFKF